RTCASFPLRSTTENFGQTIAGNLVVKVIYLPDRENQDFVTVAGAEELVSTRLEPGADPVAEAQRRGTILAIVRLGNIDLENRASPPITAPPGVMMLPPGAPVPAPRGPVPGPGMGSLPNVPSYTDPLLPSRPTTPAAPTGRPSGPLAPGPLPPGAPGTLPVGPIK